VTSRELIVWSSRHERRARRWWTSPWVVEFVAGGALCVPVEWRLDAAGPIAASHAWLAGTLVAFALSFMRVPFHLYWRADAPLLAQLPIEGGPLVDAALLRCIRAAAATTLTALIGAAPLLRFPLRMYSHHAGIACVLGAAAAGFMPAVALWAASLVARTSSGARAARAAYALASGAPVRAAAASQAPVSSGTVLGALPGFASSIVIVLVLIASPWLVDRATTHEVAPLLGGLVVASVLALVATRVKLAPVMGTILRDVSALDRQRLATLEIHAPTALERTVAAALGDAGLPYRKDARLMRRRYPMAFALGALAFLVLVIVGLSRPEDPAPWLVATLAGSGVYALALAGRLFRPPIELPRLSATLPISKSARTRAKIAWVTVWLTLFVVAPAAFALARTWPS
jgi:hypothetical protein